MEESSYDEAAAVYELLERFRGPGVAPASAYAAVERFLKAHPDRLDVLRLFGYYDRIVGSTKTSDQDVAKALELAVKIGDPGAIAFLTSVQAVRSYESGDAHAAKEQVGRAWKLYASLAVKDVAYAKRALENMKNAIIFAALDGEFTSARGLLEDFSRSGFAAALAEQRRFIGDAPKF